MSTDWLGARFDDWISKFATDADLPCEAEEHMRTAWNAAVAEAADRCVAMCHYYQAQQQWTSPDEAADACKDAVRKLYSEPIKRTTSARSAP